MPSGHPQYQMMSIQVDGYGGGGPYVFALDAALDPDELVDAVVEAPHRAVCRIVRPGRDPVALGVVAAESDSMQSAPSKNCRHE